MFELLELDLPRNPAAEDILMDDVAEWASKARGDYSEVYNQARSSQAKQVARVARDLAGWIVELIRFRCESAPVIPIRDRRDTINHGDRCRS
jgi:hypothetical protein